MLFLELRKHGQLAAKRHPMYEKNKIGKYLMYIGYIFWALYLIFFGVSFAHAFADGVPNMEPYHILNSGLIIILALDFFVRFPFQKTPTQEVKPYLLLPVRRNRILDFLLIRSGLNGFNLFWLFLFIPFAIITITPYYHLSGVITYCIGIWLLIIFNNYWFLLCRTLINERIWWIFLPILVYAGIAAAVFLPEKSLLSNFFIDLGEGYIEANPLAFLGTLLAIVLLWLINRKVIAGLVYNEINKVEDTKVKHVSEYKFFERYGEVGEYMRLELKMLLRNKRCKASLRSIAIVVLLFSAILSFTEIYDNAAMQSFIAVYSFVVFGMVILIQIMCFEGNYIDGLMTRKESIMSLLKAKYYIYSIAELIPFTLMIPAMVTGKITFFSTIVLIFFTIGPIYFMFFQMAVYNNKTTSLNEGVTARQGTNSLQMVVSFAAFGIPMLFYGLLPVLLGEVAGKIVLLIIGIGFVLTSNLWIKNVYKRFMKRRYKNMEGFRDSRQ